MRIEKCTIEDIQVLARMNKCLIEDERSSNPMNLSQLEERMQGFLLGDYDAYFVKDEDEIVGYALVDRTSDPLYLRQFYIEREQRRKHYGESAFRALLEYLGTDRIDIDVLPWNEAGVAFWRSLGFTEKYVAMRYTKE
ncbi:MAG: GNAT family N-acetyltransferase [Clostridiales bacterium]|nr:GNAT family N-acetyltransferase [Clostridiales bacterium]